LDPTRDFQIEATLHQTAGKAAAYGILWGLRDASAFYEFSVWGDNRFTCAERVGNQFSHLLDGETGRTDKSSPITLTVRKRGAAMDFLIDGRSVGRTDVRDFFGSNVGFVVNGGMTIEIDRLVITQSLDADSATSPAPPPQPVHRAPGRPAVARVPGWAYAVAIVGILALGLVLVLVLYIGRGPPGKRGP
jgi:hypothetical protein